MKPTTYLVTLRVIANQPPDAEDFEPIPVAVEDLGLEILELVECEVESAEMSE